MLPVDAAAAVDDGMELAVAVWAFVDAGAVPAVALWAFVGAGAESFSILIDLSLSFFTFVDI